MLDGIKNNNENEEKNNKNNRLKRFLVTLVCVYATLWIMAVYVGSFSSISSQVETITYNEFLDLVDEGKVDTVYYNKYDEQMHLTLYNTESLKMLEDEGSTENFEYQAEDMRITTYPAYEDFRKDMLEKNVNLVITQSSQVVTSNIASIFSLLLPVGLLVFLFLSMKNSGLSVLNKSNNVLVQHSNKKFSDVIGQDEILDDIKFVTNLIKNPDLGKDLGAKVPKGILLVGEPGTGKTLIAKAIAGEAGVPFIYANASGFIEMFVGVGAKRVRELFETAKKNKPCIIFIDEIDAIGKKRSNTGNTSENDQTINQLLQEMDGFAERDGIFVIAATNRLEDLDDALVRAGRFDRHIIVPRPRNWSARLQIFKHYFKDSKLCEDVDLENIAKQTHNFTGADIEMICNEATLIAVMKEKQYIDRECIEEAIDKKIFKGNRSKEKQYEKDIEIVAYHESGHAVMNYLMKQPMSRASIISSTSGVGGYVMGQDSDSFFTTKQDFEARVKVCYAGRASEYIKFSSVTTGASNDITQATQLLHAYIAKYGFDTDNTGIIDLDILQHEGIPNEKIIERIKTLSTLYYNETVNLLKNNYKLVEDLAQMLLVKETMSGKEIEDFFKNTETN